MRYTLQPRDRLVYVDPADLPDPSYGHLYDTPYDIGVIHATIPYVEIDLATGSDYSGSLVEKSNYQVFLELSERMPEDGIIAASGGHGTYALLIRKDVLDAEQLPGRWTGNGPDAAWVDAHYWGVAEQYQAAYDELQEYLERLESYPLLDDELESRLEMEATDDAWESWARYDFIRAIRQLAGDEVADELDELPADELRQIFEDTREVENVYWENEESDSMYVDVDRVAKRYLKTRAG